MDYIGVKALSEKWGLSERRIRIMCSEGRIEGAIKLSWSWAVPANVEKPKDGRVMKKQKEFIRLGTLNLDQLNKFKQEVPLDAICPQLFDELILNIINIAFNFNSKQIREKQISTILSGTLVPSVSLEKHLLVSNFKALINYAKNDTKDYNSLKFQQLFYSLFQGVDNQINDKMESFFLSLEREYKNIHPLYKAILTFVHILKVKPLEQYNEVFSFFILSYIIVQNGFILPLLDEEVKVCLLTVMTKSNYLQIVSYIYSSLVNGYNKSLDI